MDNRFPKSKINSKRIDEIFRDCLFKENEIENKKLLFNYSAAEGINACYFFNSQRLNKYKSEIIDYILHLPKIEEGISFLSMCIDNENIQWTDSHKNVEQLLVLGLATEVLKYVVDRELWDVLPGQMPYAILDKTKLETEVLGNAPESLHTYIKSLKK